jgi:hypothetical protein
MLTMNNISADYRLREAGGVQRVQARVEVSYVDAAKVGSFAVAKEALPGIGAGDQIYVSSGGTGAYRRVLRVEPLAGGAVMILLDPGYGKAAAAPVPVK